MAGHCLSPCWFYASLWLHIWVKRVLVWHRDQVALRWNEDTARWITSWISRVHARSVQQHSNWLLNVGDGGIRIGHTTRRYALVAHDTQRLWSFDWQQQHHFSLRSTIGCSRPLPNLVAKYFAMGCTLENIREHLPKYQGHWQCLSGSSEAFVRFSKCSLAGIHLRITLELGRGFRLADPSWSTQCLN